MGSLAESTCVGSRSWLPVAPSGGRGATHVSQDQRDPCPWRSAERSLLPQSSVNTPQPTVTPDPGPDCLRTPGGGPQPAPNPANPSSPEVVVRRFVGAGLERYKVPNSQAHTIAKMGQRVGRPRNTFAHSLTGSYWETDESIAAMFTTEAMEDSLYTVGAMAILIEEIVTARATKEENSE